MNININIDNNDEETNWFLHCFQEFGNIPNTIILSDYYVGELLKYLKIKEVNSSVELFPTSIDSNELFYINKKSLNKIDDYTYISFLELNKNTSDALITDVCLYFKYKEEDRLKTLLEDIQKYKFNLEDNNSGKFNVISVGSEDGLSIQPIHVNIGDIEIEECYNSKIIKDIKKLKKKLKNTDKGLSIFYGPKGNGKTEMVKKLVSELDKISVFIPSNTLDMTINNPAFKVILERTPNLIIIIDDCEFFTSGNFSKMNYITNNIVQLVDSVMSDHLNLQIILVFNEDSIDDIDDNLKDCNNLLEIINFDSLNSKLSTELSKTLGDKNKYTTSQRLVDVIKNRKSDSKTKIGL